MADDRITAVAFSAHNTAGRQAAASRPALGRRGLPVATGNATAVAAGLIG
jgi:hypothetical protein